MYTVYEALQRDLCGSCAGGGAELLELSLYIFGDASYTLKHIVCCVKAGIASPPPMGRRAHFPREAESVLFRFIAKLRHMKLPVYKSTVIDYAMRLLKGMTHAVHFATVLDTGKELTYKWDMVRTRRVA